MADVTDADREAVEKWCRERGWLCPPEGAEQAIARARAEGRAEERERIHAALNDLPEPFAYRHDPLRLDAFNEGVQHAMNAIRARGEKGKD